MFPVFTFFNALELGSGYTKTLSDHLPSGFTLDELFFDYLLNVEWKSFCHGRVLIRN